MPLLEDAVQDEGADDARTIEDTPAGGGDLTLSHGYANRMVMKWRL